MMKWCMPAKTFMIGEYAAIAGAPAFVLTTSPCFELALCEQPGLHGIHPDSPAGQWWQTQNNNDVGLQWFDPYQGRGGLGASSAQFVGVFFAHHYLQHTVVESTELLNAYFQSAWHGIGARPSGYDVLAQMSHGCVYVDPLTSQPRTWPFSDLSFLLLHTGQKLATHHHLQALTLPQQLNRLTQLVDEATLAFETADSYRLVATINAYHQQLAQMNLVATHTLNCIDDLKKQDDVLAIKGCGAMGADVLFVLTPTDRVQRLSQHLNDLGFNILATLNDLHTSSLQNNPKTS